MNPFPDVIIIAIHCLLSRDAHLIQTHTCPFSQYKEDTIRHAPFGLVVCLCWRSLVVIHAP